MNMKFFVMLGIVFTALAAPVAVVVLGVRQFSAKRTAEPAPEVPALRASLEEVTSRNLPPPESLSAAGRGSLDFTACGGDPAALIGWIEKAARDAGGSMLKAPSSKEGTQRILVSVPPEAGGKFESALARAIPMTISGEKNRTGFYEILVCEP